MKSDMKIIRAVATVFGTFQLHARLGEDGFEDGLVTVQLRQERFTRTHLEYLIDCLNEMIGDIQRRPQDEPLLRDRVFAANDYAVENGYVENFERVNGKSIYDCDPNVLADDIVWCNADFEGVDPLELVDHVKAWQDARRPK
jgi:hypothetical protein